MSKHTDKERLRGLREACGYVQNGSSQSVSISQDDATKDWIVHIGSGPYRKWFYAPSFNELLDRIAEHYSENHHV